MARTITDEDIKLNIIINGNASQKQLYDLEKNTRKVTEENKQLKLELGRVEKSLGKNSTEYKELSAKIKANTAIIDDNKATMRELQKQIGITGLTMKQLGQEASLLKMQLANAIPGSEAYKKYDTQLSAVTDRLNELKGKAKDTEGTISSLADKFNKYQALAFSIIAGLTGVALSIQKIIDLNGKLSDAQADVMKTTGMTKDEVDELTKSFGLLETRTSRIDLLKIAEQGGRLGIPKAEIQDFVKEMNVAAVALGDSFTGGVDEVAEKLGKIKFLFKETKDADIATSYQAIGSAINDLGANGVASEANIAEFTKRIGSLTDVLKPTVQETLALGAAFEESGIEAETSSRAYNIFMKQASTESSKFAKVMGISKQAVEDMINTNPLDFMLEFSKGLNGMDATEVAKTLDFLGVNADGANKVIGAMGNNFDRFHQLIDISNSSFDKGSSLITEYDVKNNNLAATLDKVGKKVNGWFSSEGFNKWLFSLVNGFARLIGATDDADDSAKKWRNTLVFTAKVIAIVISAMVTSVGWQKLVALWTTRNTEASILYNIAAKARAFADGVTIISTQLLAAAQMLLAGNLRGAAQAFRVMTATMMTTPWGFLLGAIAAIGTAYLVFSDNAKEAATAQSIMAENSREIDGLVKSESNSFMGLLSIINDTKASTEARTAALIKAKEIGGKYTEGLTLENAATFEGKKMIDEYIKSLERKMTLQVLEGKQKEILEKIQDKKNQKLEEEVNYWDEIWTLTKNMGNAGNSSSDLIVLAASRRQKSLKSLQTELKFTNEQMKSFLEANPDVIKNIDSGKSDYNIPGDKGDQAKAKNNPNSSQEDINRLRVENDSKYNDILLKNRRQLEDDKISTMQEGYEKELAIENLRYQRELEDLQRQKVHIEEMAKLDEEISKAKKDGDLTLYNAKLVQKKVWGDRNKILDEQINQIIEGKRSIHFYKLATIEEKAAKDAINKSKQKFEADKVLRETKFQEQLAALGNNEIAKAKLKKEFDASELVEQEKFLKELIDKFNIIVGKGKLENIDLSLLTPQQVEEFTAEAAKVGLSLAELIAKRNELVGKSDVSNAQTLGLNKGNTDILGFTQDNWKQFYDNLQAGKFGVDEMIFAVSALTDMYAKYSSFVSANENRQLQQFERSSDKKKIRLKRQLDTGYINQSQYDKQIKKIDDEVDKRKAELAYKQAKREKAIAIMSAITGTATAVIGALGNHPWTPFNIALAGIVGAMGALNIATIATTPLPAKGYEQGLYPVKREQDGKIFQSRFGGKTRSGLVNKPTYFLTGENGPEMIIDSRAYSKIHPQVKDALWNELNGIKGWEQGKYNKTTQRFEVPASSTTPSVSNNNDEALRMNAVVMAEVLEVLKDLRDKPIQALVDKNDKKSMKNIKQGVDDYNDFRNKNKY